MSRSGSRSGSNSSRRGSGSSRPKWDDDARQGQRGSSSRGRPESARTTRHNDDHGRNGGNGSAQNGGLWGDEGGWQGGESWAGDAAWSNDGGWGETGLNNAPAAGQRAGGGSPNPKGKQPFSRRIRYWFTADAWQMNVLRQWPSMLRLLLAAGLLGSCAGLSFFVTRDQANAQGPASGRTSLAQQHVGPGTPTVALYQQDPWTPPALPSPTATPKPKPTATAVPIGLQAQLSSPGAQCQNAGDTLQPVTLTLTNSQSGVENWTLNLGPGPDGQPWAQPSASQGSVPAKTQQPVTLTPDPTICALLSQSGKPSVQLTTKVSVTPGAQPPTLIYVVSAPPGGGPGPTPSPSPNPSPAVSPSPSAIPSVVP